MHILLEKALSAIEIERVKALVSTETFTDGRATSGVAGKRNLQLPIGSEAAQAAGAIILDRLRANEAFDSAVLPLLIQRPLFSLYEAGMEYPDHTDVAIMGGIRADLAMTLFLNERDTYDGGELIIDTGNGVRPYRLDAGDAVVYPATTVHHVAKVTRGTRLAAVLWIQSRIRDPAQRQILCDLAAAMRSPECDEHGLRLRRSYWNLVRLWANS
ncbi:Fe2+-dependent dioxygenase [Sorangium sp. So ce1335]|uniref:Fe2+-dependent dioxygenase n=1 Tax=Sorangium sp. So ce1335 TaxID=3133335 RepID=UPI003F63AFB3